MKKATACAAVFVILLLWGWQAERKVPSESPLLQNHPEGQLHMQQLKSSRYDGFRPREYVRMIRYGEQLAPDLDWSEPGLNEPDQIPYPSNTY